MTEPRTVKGKGSAGLWARLKDRSQWPPFYAPEPEAIPEPGPHYDQRKALHDELSKTIRRVFYALIGTSLFCVVTLAGTPDAELLTPEATVKLPILNYDMEFEAFLVVAPIVLIALTIYLHIFVGQHRKYPVLEENCQPMLPNFSSRTAKGLILLIFYWMVPLTLAVFAWKAQPRPVGPYLSGLTLGVTAILVILQARRSPREWRGKATLALLIVSSLFIVGIASVPGWRQLELFKADLSGKDLRNMNLKHAFMQEADVSEADLSGTDLSGADLSTANLSEANLKAANLSGADLSAANLSRANFFWRHGKGAPIAYLSGANLSGANLSGANLELSDLSGADLTGADLTEANLKWANGLELDELYRAKNWLLAYYDIELTETMALPLDHNERLGKRDFRQYALEKADLLRADLNGVDLSGANLRGADVGAADLRGANLRGADLRGAILSDANLSGADLSDADLSGADLSDADLSGADLTLSNLRDADFFFFDIGSDAELLTARKIACNQLRSAGNWETAYRDPEMACGASIPELPSKTTQQ